VLRKLIEAVEYDLGDDARWDDAAEVRATDDEIIVRYEKPA
jgi:hypothetical protein